MPKKLNNHLIIDTLRKYKIPIQSLCYKNRYQITINNITFQFNYMDEQKQIILFENGRLNPYLSWNVYEKEIGGSLRRNGYVPWENNIQYFVYGADRKRYRNLYIFPT